MISGSNLDETMTFSRIYITRVMTGYLFSILLASVLIKERLFDNHLLHL